MMKYICALVFAVNSAFYLQASSQLDLLQLNSNLNALLKQKPNGGSGKAASAMRLEELFNTMDSGINNKKSLNNFIADPAFKGWYPLTRKSYPEQILQGSRAIKIA